MFALRFLGQFVDRHFGFIELLQASQQMLALASGSCHNSLQNFAETLDEVDEDAISRRLYTAKLPEVDLMIRTGGDMRVSNFLLWQISYSEIWITEKCWPEFTREDFLNAICEFNSRQRRFGGLNVNE